MGVCACSSSGNSSGGTATGSGASTPSTGSTSAGGSPSASGTGGSPADAATTKSIAQAYSAFFNPKASLAVAEQNLQHGTVFKAALLAQAHDPQAQGISARVTSVTLLSPNSAAVRFDLLSGGKPLLPNNPGNAVREDGRWKVAAETFCQLIQVSGQHPPAACSDPKITGLPN